MNFPATGTHLPTGVVCGIAIQYRRIRIVLPGSMYNCLVIAKFGGEELKRSAMFGHGHERDFSVIPQTVRHERERALIVVTAVYAGVRTTSLKYDIAVVAELVRRVSEGESPFSDRAEDDAPIRPHGFRCVLEVITVSRDRDRHERLIATQALRRVTQG